MFTKTYIILLIKKIKPIYVKTIDGWFLSFGDITHKIIPINVAINDYNSLIIFNIIRSSINLIILGLLLKIYIYITLK